MKNKVSLSASVLLIGVVSAICFLPSLYGNFIFDDTEAVVNNKDVLTSSRLKDIFANDFWGTNLISNNSHKSYRPLTVLSFKLNVYLRGGIIEPFGFHFLNVILHCLVSLLTFSVFLRLTKNKIKESLIAAVLFAVHPVHTEAVASVVGRADLLSTFFALLSLLSYFKASRANSSKLNCAFWTFTSISCTALALFCKEQGIAILGVCIVYDLVFICHILPVQSLRLPHINDRAITRIFVVFIACIGLMFYRCYLMNFQVPNFHRMDNPASYVEDSFLRIINYSYIWSINFWLLLCPVWLCFDWSMGCVPLIGNSWIFEPRILGVLSLFLFLCSMFKLVLFSKGNNSLAMAVCLLIIPFLPASNILIRVGFVLAERILYLPSIGFCLLISLGFSKLLQCCPKWVAPLNISLVLLILVGVCKCWKRSLDWENETSLFNSALSVCPLNAKVHYNIAKTSSSVEDAIESYHTALSLYPEYEHALNNLANILRDLGHLEEAEKLLRKAIKVRPSFPAAWMNLGIALANQGRYGEAETAYMTALSHRSHYPDCYYNLGNLYLAIGKHDQAYDFWRKATSLKSTHSVAWNNMIVMLDSNGDYRRAELIGMEALKSLPNDSSLHFNLGNTFGKQGKLEQAEHHFKLAIELRPDHSLYHSNLGVLYHRWKKYHLAQHHYRIAIDLDPVNSKSASDNLRVISKFV